MTRRHEEGKAYRILLNDSAYGTFPLPSYSAYRRILAFRMNKTEEDVDAILRRLEEEERFRIDEKGQMVVAYKKDTFDY